MTKKQTRLFDYVDLVGDETKVDVIDIDNDGDKDYLFLLGESLYVKYTSLVPEKKSIDTTITTTSLDTALLPRAPDFFHEIIASPGQMEVSFSPSIPEETSFRLEFFDRYLEWDRVTLL